MKKNKLDEHHNEVTQQLFEEGNSSEKQLTLLAEISQNFSNSLDISQTLQNAIERFMQYLNSEAASIFLLENNNSELVCVRCAGPVDIAGIKIPSGKGIIGNAINTRKSQMIRDAQNDPNFSKSVDAGTGFKTRSILAVPLVVNDKCIGALELINKKNDDLFNEHDESISMVLASYAALAIHNARMADALVEKERMRKELELAREIQIGLLPKDDDTNIFPIKGMNVPALEVSGDFYDFFKRDDGLIYFNLADVSGKGMNAAMLMAKASSLLHHLAKSISDPGELLGRVNNEICESISHGMFVTIVSGFLDAENDKISFSNAGHQPPLFHNSKGEFVEIKESAPPIGIIPGTEFSVETIHLDGGAVYLFTDGVTESHDENKKFLEVSGLIKLIEINSKLPIPNRLDRIVSKIRNSDTDQHDDITLMIIECSKK
ncbi:MAG: GAF domain-containing SpoIIE family protein phosphatase [Pseudomonadota bacterium]|nr:GAF domain-containing SpoIIE family protein phosphatase [Pseudomonadota bacterium]